MEASFSARITQEGKVKWNRPQDAADFFRACAGQRVTITVTPGKRSLRQNKLLHAIFKEFGDRTGYSPAICKEFMKRAYIDDGRGTSELDIEESSDFAEWAQAWMAQHLK